MLAEERLTLVLPMYNEEENVIPLLEKVKNVWKRHKLNLKVVAVNDGSGDNTWNQLMKATKTYPFLQPIKHPKNQGVAAALKTGIKEALELKSDFLVFMDADLTHDPDDIPKFLAKIKEGYDFVVGSRYVRGGGMKGVSLFRVLVSFLGNLAARLILRVPLRDYTTGYRMIRREVFEFIKIEEKGFGIQLEEVVKAYSAGFKLGEVPIILTSRVHGRSSMYYNFSLVKNYFQLFRKSLIWLRKAKPK